MDPLGLVMLIGCSVGRTLMTAALIVAKLPVLPVSAIVAGTVGGDGVTEGGPSGVSLLVQDGSVVIVVFSLVALLLGWGVAGSVTVTRRVTVHQGLIAIVRDGVVSAKHVYDGGIVAMGSCFVKASKTGVVGAEAISVSPTTITAPSRDAGSGCRVASGSGYVDGRVGGMAAAQSCIGGRHIFATAMVGSFEVGLEVGPGLVGIGFVVPLLDGPIEHAGADVL